MKAYYKNSFIYVLLLGKLLSFKYSFTQHKLHSKKFSTLETISEADTDYIVIGSGIGGLSCAALLSYYGYSVTVLESHYLPGGVAHTFEKDGFKFDAGPSLWNGMATKPFNPLREVLGIACTFLISIDMM